MPATNLLIRMQSTRIHMALVVDEYGGISGLVTTEDLLEELIKSDQPGPQGQVPEPVRSVPTMVDDGLLEELAQMGTAEQPDQKAVIENVRAAAAPEAMVRQDVLNDLLTDRDAGKKDDEDKAR